ncbi:MAG: FAD-dependent oxidoreductase [Elusimicrobiota bacterium]|nr:FAD-dependent oxidoreductase [Elusimicrobiota bacterium]
MSRKKYVIIGNGVAGTKAAETLRQIDSRAEITIISPEQVLSYSKVLLTDYIVGKISKTDLFLRDKNFYKSYRINLLLGYKAKRVIPEKHKVLVEEIANGSVGRKKVASRVNVGANRCNVIQYDKLLVASGSSPKFPDIHGINLHGVFGLSTLNDAEKIKRIIEKPESFPVNVVIVGGGLIGCKVASALSTLPRSSTKIIIVVSSQQLLSQMLDERSAEIILHAAYQYGITVKFKTDVVEILSDKSKSQVIAVKLSDGTVLPADIVIVAKGVKPNVDFFSGTKVKINRGIIVDNKLQTSLPDIYAAGDVAESYDYIHKQYQVNAMWPNALRQGEIAALNMAGKTTNYDGSININTGDFFGITAFSVGNVRSSLNKNGHLSNKFYERFFFDSKNNFIGYICVSSPETTHRLRTAGYLQTFLNKILPIMSFRGRSPWQFQPHLFEENTSFHSG